MASRRVTPILTGNLSGGVRSGRILLRVTHTLLPPMSGAWLRATFAFFCAWLSDMLATLAFPGRTGPEHRALAHAALKALRRELAFALLQVALSRVPARRATKRAHPRNTPRGSRRARHILKLRAFVRLIPSPRGLLPQLRALWRAVRRFGDYAERFTRRWAVDPRPRAIVLIVAPRDPVVSRTDATPETADTS